MRDDQIVESEKPEAVSAGGMVVSSYGESVRILLVRDINYDDWVCPKGHVEPGETLGQAALREIKEEAGVTEANILFELGTARRYVKTIPEWKTIHYFLILTTPDQPLGPLESGLMEAKWFFIEKLPKMHLPEQLNIITDNFDKIKSIIRSRPF